METVIICFLCGNDTVKHNLEFYDIQSSVVPASQKPIHVVLQHLANCIKYKLIFQSAAYICSDCFKELSDYDDLMLNLLFSQRRLTVLLQNALDKPEEPTVLGGSTVFKDESSPSMDIEVELDDDKSNASLADAFDPNLDAKEEFIAIDEDTIIEETTENQTEDSILSNEISDNSCASQNTYSAKTERKRPDLKCNICGEQFKSKYLIQNHMSASHNVKQFCCKICGISKKDEEYLELHMNIHEGKSENECRYCPKRFSRPVNTLRHMRIHWDKKKFQCEKCGERFSLDNMLYNHRLRHEAEENPVICSICNQSFKSRKTYTHHLLIHQENRPRHYCHLCPKSFTERYTLKMHLKTHDGYKSSDSPSISTANTKEAEKEYETEEAIGILVESDSYDSDNTYVICSRSGGLEDHDNHDVILK